MLANDYSQRRWRYSKEGDCALGVWRFNAQIAKQVLLKIIVLDELFFRFVDGEGFKEFIVIACPKFHINFGWTVACNFLEIFINHKNEIKI